MCHFCHCSCCDMNLFLLPREQAYIIRSPSPLEKERQVWLPNVTSLHLLSPCSRMLSNKVLSAHTARDHDFSVWAIMALLIIGDPAEL
ncbi:hypothetical protein BRADI_4g43965v3 [Brachypodium distachyon]|uniref:Uncharacterized protein n=1 Tax=Brachypodium distachyon TaxID=15368 RepID=A0A2K2CU27_BRADI|nr:hypothetical protein BRADI_4g43965v3 [Brachypodium distachyon]